MGHVLNDKKEGEKQVTTFYQDWKECACIDVDGEGPRGRHSKDIM
jgi:hypothetical protein